MNKAVDQSEPFISRTAYPQSYSTCNKLTGLYNLIKTLASTITNLFGMPYPAFVASCIPLRKMCSNSRVFIVSQTEFPLNKKLSILINNLFYTVCYNSERKKNNPSPLLTAYTVMRTLHTVVSVFIRYWWAQNGPRIPPSPRSPTH